MRPFSPHGIGGGGCHSIDQFPRFCLIHYHLPMKLQEGNVFSRVCLSFCSQGSPQVNKFEHVHMCHMGTPSPANLPPYRHPLPFQALVLVPCLHNTGTPLCPHNTGTPLASSHRTCSNLHLYLTTQAPVGLAGKRVVGIRLKSLHIITARNSSWGKVMFSQVCVCSWDRQHHIHHGIGHIVGCTPSHCPWTWDLGYPHFSQLGT